MPTPTARAWIAPLAVAAALACSARKTAPLLDVSEDPKPSDLIDGGMGPSTPEGPEAGPITGPSPKERQKWAEHAVYAYGTTSDQGQSFACNLMTSSQAGKHDGVLPQMVGQVHPLTHKLYTNFSGQGDWNPLEHTDSACATPTLWAFHPGTGEVLGHCGQWTYPDGRTSSSSLRFLDIEGRVLVNGGSRMIEANGANVDIVPKLGGFHTSHSKPGGGFWVVTSNPVLFYEVEADGTRSEGLEFDIGLDRPNNGPAHWVFDNSGGLYINGMKDRRAAISRVSPDLKSTQLIFVRGDCGISEVHSLISTP